jgi:2-O-(6-phospho-alpha-D-mannosyl)-D-glycerate hydrolase
MRPTYHIVSHTHWDREWYKTFEQFRSMLVGMVDDLLDLLQRDRSYACFTLDGQAIVLEDYLAVRPERESEIRRLVADGRLVIGPWYILPDEFLVSAEATVRNLLVGRSLTRKFGTPMNVGYIPDSFGHIAMMPSILRGFGIDNAVLYRGFGGEPGQTTSEYTWTAPDGSKVLLVHLFRHGYSAGYFHQERDEQILTRFAEIKRELDARATTSHRLMLNGGDHHWPDPRLPRVLELLRRNFEGQFVHTTLPRFIEAVKREVPALPEVQGELRFGYRYAFVVLGGVYSSRMYLKQQNWQCQNLLQRYVEPLSAFAALAGMRPQLPLVRHAWRTLLQNHPHDSICGCSIDPVHREMMTRFKAVDDIGRSILSHSLNQIIPADDCASRDDRALFFVNPSPFARSEIAAADVSFFLRDILVGLNPDVRIDSPLPPTRGFVLRDEQGAEVPCQVIAKREGYDITYSNYNYPKQTYAEKFSILVDARNVPPLGFKGFKLEKSEQAPRYTTSLRVGRNFMENDFLRVEVDSGGGCSIRDKKRGTIFRGLNVFEDSGDVGDEYNYSYPRKDLRLLSGRKRAKIRAVEKGPLRGALEATLVLRVPAGASADRKARSKKNVPLRIQTTYTLSVLSRALVVRTVVDNSANDHRLRALFPTGIRTDRVLADSQFGVVERRQQKHDVRKFSIEHPARVAPMQRFVTVRGGKRGMTLFSLGMPEYELKLDGKGTLALTLLRCVGLLAGEDLITRPGGKAGWHNETPEAQCQGEQSFTYALLPHGADDGEILPLVNQEAERFHLPLLAVSRKNEPAVPLEKTFASVEGSQLVLSALKEPEEGTGIVVRLQNTGPMPAESAVRFAGPVREAWETRLDEEVQKRLEVREGCVVPVSVPPRGLFTMKVMFSDR